MSEDLTHYQKQIRTSGRGSQERVHVLSLPVIRLAMCRAGPASEDGLGWLYSVDSTLGPVCYLRTSGRKFTRHTSVIQ